METPHPIPVRGIDHVVIRVKGLEQMIDFYAGVLGCRLERGPGEAGIAQLQGAARRMRRGSIRPRLARRRWLRRGVLLGDRPTRESSADAAVQVA